MRNNYFESQKYAMKQGQFSHNRGLRETDQQLNFQNVNSVYQLAKEPIQNPYQSQTNNHRQLQYNIPSQNHPLRSEYKHPTSYRSHLPQPHNPYNKQIPVNRQTLTKNSSSKSNSQTNVISQSQSLEYLSSQQPSFSNKGEFTVCEDFNVEPISPVKHQLYEYRQLSQRRNHNWGVDTFSQKPQQNYNRHNNLRKPLTLYDKCTKAYQQIQQLKFMKQGLESRLKQQKITFTNQIQQLKKHLFKLNIKYEKEMLQFTKQDNRPMSRQSSMRQSSVKDENLGQNELIELRSYCKRLEEEKAKSEQKYQLTLKKYQEEIEMISEEFEKKLTLERSSNLPGFGKEQCANCINNYKGQRENIGRQAYEIDMWKTRFHQQQQNHSQAMKRLQQKVLSLQEQFQHLEKSKTQAQKTIKQKQKQLLYREAEIQYRLKDIDRRERDLQMADTLLQKQKDQLQRKKDKIADYELKVLKEERKQKNQIKEKDIMTSEYFNNCEKKQILGKGPQGNQDRSDSLSSKGSRIDINARLKQIQMLRNRTSRVYDQNTSSRNSSKDSRSSGYKDYATSRVSVTTRNLTDYGVGQGGLGTPKQPVRGNSQTIKLSEKLNKLTETLQKQLRQMD